MKLSSTEMMGIKDDEINNEIKAYVYQPRINIFKIVASITIGIISIILTALFAVLIYKNNFALESILSVLLAFFSIFIAIIFFFKADEANSRFYISSYNFMKDVSVTLGKIEERFGEKLNSVNDKLSQLEVIKRETKVELENTENEKDKLIDELLEKANMTEKERENYKNVINDKQREATILKNKLAKFEDEYNNLNFNLDNNSIEMKYANARIFSDKISKEILVDLLNGISVYETPLSKEMINFGKLAGVLTRNGQLTAFGKRIFLEEQ